MPYLPHPTTTILTQQICINLKNTLAKVRRTCSPQSTPWRRPGINPVSNQIKFGMYVEVDEWCTTVCSVTRSKVKVKVTSPSNLEIRPFSQRSPPRFTMGAGNWPRILKVVHKIWSGRIFDICHSDFEIGSNVSCEELTVSPVRG